MQSDEVSHSHFTIAHKLWRICADRLCGELTPRVVMLPKCFFSCEFAEMQQCVLAASVLPFMLAPCMWDERRTTLESFFGAFCHSR